MKAAGPQWDAPGRDTADGRVKGASGVARSPQKGMTKMLNIYYGRESINKEKHLFAHLAEGAIVLVPEQFTLQAEREALYYLNSEGLLETEILSFSSLGRNILAEAGGARRATIDRYGRHMLLAKILEEQKDNLTLYQRYAKNAGFLELINDMISQLKQYGVTPLELAQVAEELPTEKQYLGTKLTDIGIIYTAYEERISGKYVDTEDRIGLYCEKLPDCASLKKRQISLFGFDYFTPNNLKFLAALVANVPEVNVYLTYGDEVGEEDLFALGRLMIRRLRELAEEAGVEFAVTKIGSEYAREDRSAALAALEKNLFALPTKAASEDEGITLVRAAGYYGEAAAAAREIRRLVTEEGYRYRDIALICNDLSVRGAVYKRVFAGYDLNLFLDRKRGVSHNPAVKYCLALLAVVGKGYRKEDIFGLLKTGLTDLPEEAAGQLENYCENYHIYGNAFKKPFVKGRRELGDETFAELEQWRGTLAQSWEDFGAFFKAAKTVEEKAKALFIYLDEKAKLPEKLQALVDLQLSVGESALAAETAQIWNVTMEVLDQMVAVMGKEPISMANFTELFRAGVDALEVGLLPPSADGLTMGTMERTRTGNVRAIFVLGANEGVLPLSASGSEVLTEEEKEYLSARDVTLCKMDRLRAMEENLAIYRNLCKATERLWVSYAATDQAGKDMAPSQIVDTLKEIYPNMPISGDGSLGSLAERIGGRGNTLVELGRALKRDGVTEETAALWQWYEKAAGAAGTDSGKAAGATTGAADGADDGKAADVAGGADSAGDGKSAGVTTDAVVGADDGNGSMTGAVGAAASLASLQRAFARHRDDAPIGRENAMALYERTVYDGALTVSPSRLERFGKCPFAHFVRYGLHPEEPATYDVQAFDMGSVYHEVFKTLSERLTKEGVAVTDPASPWMTITDEQRDELVDEVLQDTIANYREGLLTDGKEMNYRAERIRQVAKTSAKFMVDQVRLGQIESMGFEVPFGDREKDVLPAITLVTPDGAQAVKIGGVIDRVDVLPGDEVKVIDYKSGKDVYDEAEARSGWKLQLFLYLEAAKAGGKENEAAGATIESADGEAAGAAEHAGGDVVANGVDATTKEVGVAERLDGEAAGAAEHAGGVVVANGEDATTEEAGAAERAGSGIGAGRKVPVGAFYFHVDDPVVDGDQLKGAGSAAGLAQAVEEKVRKAFTMNGFMVARDQTVANIAGADPVGGAVLGFKSGKAEDADGNKINVPVPNASLAMLTEAEFEELTTAVADRVSEMATEMVDGRIDIAPRRKLKKNKETACRYCDYKHICKFDVQFADCRYVNIDL